MIMVKPQLILAREVVNTYKEQLALTTQELKSIGIIPYLKVILVGHNPASLIYTKNKKKFAQSIGAKCDIEHFDESITEIDFLSKVNEISNNPLVHGCFIQLPLPTHLKHLDVGTLIPAKKDVDGFAPENLYKLLHGDIGDQALLSCTPKGILTLLKYYQIEVSKKHVAILGRSLIVGKPLALLLQNHDATVTMCHSKTKDLEKITRDADIIITALGKARLIGPQYFRDDQSQVVIDVGINQDKFGIICGDVDFEKVKEKVKAITPVPGGVGPMTILSLIQNLLQAAQKS